MKLHINDPDRVRQQYANSDGLSTRISIHDKYSTNKMGLMNWYFTVFDIREGMRVLELGAGTGKLWTEHGDVLERCSEVVLSDLSEGMLKDAEKNIGAFPNVKYRVIDIQDIPYEDGYFDVVIANYMLYHVPDIDKALSEVSRVLRDGGVFYAGTTGENGVMETIGQWLGLGKIYVNTFSLQNGGERLERFFSKVEIARYIDSLEVTDLDELMEYIYSGITFRSACTLPKDEVRRVLADHMTDGVLKLPKEPGMFVSVK